MRAEAYAGLSAGKASLRRGGQVKMGVLNVLRREGLRYLYFALALTLFILASACTTIQIGEPYDKVIDDDLNGYQKQVVEFIKTMEQNAGNNEGRYASPTAKKFYASSSATLANLQLRADVLSGRTCPIARVEALVTAAGFAVPATTAPESAEDIYDTAGNCVSIVLRGVRLAHADLEEDHKELGRLTPAVALLNRQAIEAAIRVALLAVHSKKY